MTRLAERIRSAAELRDHLTAATSATPEGYRRRVGFGPFSLSLTVHGARSAPAIARALLPAREGDAVRLAIHVVDAETCAAPRMGLDWEPRDFGLKRTVPGWSTEDLLVLYLRTHEGLAVVDWKASRAIVWVPSLSAFPAYELAAPLRWLFDLIAVRFGLMTLHAACVGLPGCGLLIAGASGSGKSTLALSAAAEGLAYVGDDYCLLEPGPETRAHALYPTGKLRPDGRVQPASAKRLGPATPASPEGKAIVHLDPTRLARFLPAKAIILPEFCAGPDASLTRAGAHDAFRRLAPSTLMQSEAASGPLAAEIARLTRALPAYRLSMPPEPRVAVAALRSLAERLADEARATA